MYQAIIKTVCIFVCLCSGSTSFSQSPVVLKYAPAPAGNPLKGLVPYAGERDQFPHSMEFNYVGFAEIVKGYDQYDWQPMERLLNDIASRGHQAIFRIYLEFPGKKNIIPQFLVDDGLTVHKYLNTNTQPLDHAQIETPDYEDARLRRVMTSFIKALGEKYDGDPRIGFITAGLLGTWGEWHTHPRNELFASKEVQAEVMDAYEAAFKKTRVLLRYPVGSASQDKAANAIRPFGYHDDSFAWATLHTGKRDQSWFYMATLQEAGEYAMAKWKTQPIGGEIRPEAWGNVFDEQVGDERIQDFRECVEQTHVSWLMDSGMFRKGQPKERQERAEQHVQRMGYEFHIPQVNTQRLPNGKLAVEVSIENRGVAPFYYEWPLEMGIVADGKLLESHLTDEYVTEILPGQTAKKLSFEVSMPGRLEGNALFVLRVVNPLANGVPLCFANESQDRDLAGWLTLCPVPK